MTTPRQFEANRSNARASTGPRSKAGKARAGRNARRHGLSSAIASDLAEALARRIADDGAGPAVMALARAFAEAQIDLDRVPKVRRHVLGRLMADPDDGAEDKVDRSKLVRQLRRLERYEHRALARRRRAIRAFDQS